MNRTAYNALVDDNGSNTVGSRWDKAAIKNVLLDPIDAALGVWTNTPFNAADYTADVGSCVVPSASVYSNRWTVIGNTLVWSLYVNPGTLSGSPTYLWVRQPLAGVRPFAGGYQAVPTNLLYDNGVIRNGFAQVYDATRIVIRPDTTSAFGGGGSVAFWLNGVYELT